MSRLQSAAGRVPQSWSFGQWPLRRKLAAALALPVILAFVFGGLRVKTDFDAARRLSSAADTIQVIRPVVEYNLAVQRLAAADGIGGGGTIAAIRNYENAAANLRIALKTPGIPGSVTKNAQNALVLGQAVRTAKTQKGFSDIVIDKSGNTATLMSTVVSDLGLSDDSASARIVVAMQDTIAAQRAMTGQQLNLANTDDAAANLRAIGQVGAETAALTRVQTTASIDQAGAIRQLLNENGRRNYTLAQDPIEHEQVVGLGTVFESSNAGYTKLLDTQLTALQTNLRGSASSHQRDAAVNSIVIGGALLIALILVLGLLRSLLTPIRAVRAGALEIANKRLPEAIAAMRDGGEPPAFEPIPVRTNEEMGQLARAVDDLHNQARSLAGEQARLRVQVGHMFETLSRRSTSLIDQQLTLIERLESDEEDPKRLQSLFRLDHLAARMRRNSDSLLVLAGTSTRRGVSGAIAVSDAIRAAVSEVENYERIDIGDTSNDKVLGAVGSDLIHLVAELVDNALAYSPPTTRVAIRGARTPDGGLLVEVTDKGLGMPPKELASLNDRLANGGDITADTARRMGLFVVGSLAKRHGIAVRLRRNGDDKQGITVSVHLPAGLLADSESVDRAVRSVAKAAPGTAEAPAPLAAPVTPAVGGTTKSGLPTRVRGASGAPTVGEPSPVPGAAKKLPTRTPGAHGPNAATALPAPVKPVIEGADAGAEAPATNGAANGKDTNGSPDGAESAQATEAVEVNGHAPVDGDAPVATPEPVATEDTESTGSTEASEATESDVAEPVAEVEVGIDSEPAVDDVVVEEQVEAKAAPADAAPAAEAPAAPVEAPRLSPSGLPVRRSGASNITAYREFEDAPSTEPAATDTTAAPAAKAAPAKGNRLMSWLPGRAKAHAEAARLEAEAEETRQMPSNLSAWLDHRAKLVEAAKARDTGDVAPGQAPVEPTETSGSTDTAASEPEATEVTVPQAWVDEAAQDDTSATASETTVESTVENGDEAPAEAVASVDTQPQPEAPSAPEAHGGLPTRQPGVSAAAAEASSAAPAATPGPLARPAVRAHNSSFFGARRRGPVETPETPETPVAAEPAVAEEAPEVEAPVAEVETSEVTAPVAEVEAPEVETEVVEAEAEVEVEAQAHAEEPVEDVAETPAEQPPSAPLNDTPIFRAMMSRWLTDEPEAADASWSDEGTDRAWSAAAAVEDAQPVAESSAGLPMRRPGSQLVPGAMDQPGPQPTTPTPSRRDPETIRRNLNRHQQGVSTARTEAQDGTHREEADVHH